MPTRGWAAQSPPRPLARDKARSVVAMRAATWTTRAASGRRARGECRVPMPAVAGRWPCPARGVGDAQLPGATLEGRRSRAASCREGGQLWHSCGTAVARGRVGPTGATRRAGSAATVGDHRRGRFLGDGDGDWHRTMPLAPSGYVRFANFLIDREAAIRYTLSMKQSPGRRTEVSPMLRHLARHAALYLIRKAVRRML